MVRNEFISIQKFRKENLERCWGQKDFSRWSKNKKRIFFHKFNKKRSCGVSFVYVDITDLVEFRADSTNCQLELGRFLVRRSRAITFQIISLQRST